VSVVILREIQRRRLAAIGKLEWSTPVLANIAAPVADVELLPELETLRATVYFPDGTVSRADIPTDWRMRKGEVAPAELERALALWGLFQRKAGLGYFLASYRHWARKAMWRRAEKMLGRQVERTTKSGNSRSKSDRERPLCFERWGKMPDAAIERRGEIKEAAEHVRKELKYRADDSDDELRKRVGGYRKECLAARRSGG
jgi:hypothetical protein